MARTEKLFVTQVYRAEIGARRLVADLAATCRGVAAEDRAGQAWCRANSYRGYTSYASLTDLPQRASVFADLVGRIGPHVGRLARLVDLDLARRPLELDSLWVNILEPGGHHGVHIHPHSVISGTFYVEVPRGASAIRFEDPRLPRMMAAPPRKAGARRANATFVSLAPRPGTLLLWESWLGHEVPRNGAKEARVSISFNYRWG